MDIPVLVQPVAGNVFLARAGSPLDWTAEGATAEEALAKLRAVAMKHPEVTHRITLVPPSLIVTSVISVDEVLTGWYNVARNANRPAVIERAYSDLANAVTFFTGIPILNFTQIAIAEYDRLILSS